MEFEELIELARDSYVGQFVNFADTQLKTYPEGTPEIKVMVAEDSGLYRGLYCADFITVDPEESEAPRIIELAPEEEVTFEPIEVTLGEMEMTVEALSWHDMNLTLVDAPMPHEGGGVQGIEAWFETWFDPEDVNVDLDSRFSGHIHSLIIDGDNLHVDFGTAPVQALIDLLLLIEMNGCAGVKVF
ncbi:hypothetical protein PQU92_12020 [Asticcacaulis sp. BYS171W]|uniref:Uncharacterized protein n=1 Tax=Asticcacaulis aquaticus TaxID=2984212 RepID=A0ABT5HX45_9CAUL|nr:hypothetical protein [Asticcacaulis aquaticus]MDC7684006.1 hypothetical protein [Asticcacaulis aquaticus]